LRYPVSGADRLRETLIIAIRGKILSDHNIQIKTIFSRRKLSRFSTKKFEFKKLNVQYTSDSDEPVRNYIPYRRVSNFFLLKIFYIIGRSIQRNLDKSNVYKSRIFDNSKANALVPAAHLRCTQTVRAYHFSCNSNFFLFRPIRVIEVPLQSWRWARNAFKFKNRR